MRKLFKSVIAEKAMDDWPIGFYGNSGIDGKDYAVSTHYLRGDEVPESMMDAKTSSELIAGLLNAYYRNMDVSGMPEAEVRNLGIYDPSEDAPEYNPNQSEFPF